MQRIELFPTGGGLDGQPGGNVVSVLFELRSEILDSVRKDSKLMKKPRAVSEQYVVEKTIPRCCALSGVPSEEFRMQRLDKGKITYVFSAFRKDGTCVGERGSETEEEVGSNRHLLLGADQLTASALSECLIKRDAHHRVGAFPVANGLLENLIFLPWQRSPPIIGCATSDGGGGPPSLEQHVSPKGSAL